MMNSDQGNILIQLKDSAEPTVVESLCIACMKNGKTIMLMVKIPFFKDLLISSFSCEECGNRNNEVQFVGELPSKGISIKFKVTEVEDLKRELVKSNHANLKIEELGLEIPETGRAQISTVEGILLQVQSNLQNDQEERQKVDPQSYVKIQEYITKLQAFRNGNNLPFTVSIYDPSGHSNIKNPFAPKHDDKLFLSYFTRTKQQTIGMGYSEENAQEELKSKITVDKQENKESENKYLKTVNFNNSVTQNDFMANELSLFEINCHSCMMPGQMKMCKTNIPHFSDLIIMSFSCDYCGAHSTDTKNSGVITDKSTTITLNGCSQADLRRDLFKSESCCVKIPELELELDYGTLGGAYTTVEGLFEKIIDHMKELNSYTDSDDNFANRLKGIIEDLTLMKAGDKKFTLILQDPLSNSFLQNPFHPEEDKNATIFSRLRNEDQIDYLGLNEMDV